MLVLGQQIQKQGYMLNKGGPINSFIPPNVWYGFYFGNGGGSSNGNWAGGPTGTLAAYGASAVLAAEGSVMAQVYHTFSDEIIKTEITVIDDGKALMQINQLESKEYHYIDPLDRKVLKTIGFIAQEVKEVLPNAISYRIGLVPDEMRIISEPQWDSNVLTIPDLDMSPENLTGKCNELEIDCEKDSDGNKTNRFKFEKEYANVFFHGKEVNDFHTIDKNQIFALHHSAIQELSRKNDAKPTQITELQAELAAIKAVLNM
jgi:hypothetical protein